MCLLRQIPAELLPHLGIHNVHKGAEVGAIITAASSFAVDAILDSDGIIEVAGISPPEDSYESEQLSLFNASRNDATPASNTSSESSTIPSETQHHFEIDALGHQLQIEAVDSSLLTLNSNCSLPMAELLTRDLVHSNNF